MPVPYKSNIVENIQAKGFAQTISYMAPGDGVNPMFDGVNINYITGSNRTLFHGVPTNLSDWQQLNLWSITTGNNDGYDYTVSDISTFSVVRHGFQILKTGFYKVTCSLGLEVFYSGRFNVAIQFAKKSNNTWSRVAAPCLSGYINEHSSGTEASASVHISAMIQCVALDEIAVFSTGLGVTGDVLAVKKHCLFQIEEI